MTIFTTSYFIPIIYIHWISVWFISNTLCLTCIQITFIIGASFGLPQCLAMVVISRVLENSNFHNRVIRASKQFILKVNYDKEHRNVFTFQFWACMSCFWESCPTLKCCKFLVREQLCEFWVHSRFKTCGNDRNR